MQLIFERGHDAEVAATAPQAPEQIRILLCADLQDLAVRGHELERCDVVAGETELAHQPSLTAAKSEPGDAGVGSGAQRGGQSGRLVLGIQLT